MPKTSSNARRRLLASAAILLSLALASPSLAQTRPAVQTYDLKPQDLGQALAAAAKLSGREVMAPDPLVAGKTAPALRGRYTADQAFAILLAGANLKLAPVGDMFVVQRTQGGQAPGEPQTGAAESLSEIVVTGTRIRGAAPVGSNLVAITREDIERSGYATTQQIVQAVPQNFGGGANDTTFGYNNRNNALNNSGLGASINLRGLGAESTLVLINGSRPALGGVGGLFADVSLIPATAIERVEILPDGASALYGADAVGGVVNFTMRDAYSGLRSQMRLGAADGDFSEHQVGILAGRDWGSAHLTLAYEYYDRGRLSADGRDYAREDLRAFGGADNRRAFGSPGTLNAGGRTFALPPGQTGGPGIVPQLVAGTVNREDQQLGTDLLPAQKRHAVYLSGRVDLDDKTRASAQILYADRTFDRRYANSFLLKTSTVPVTSPYYLDPIGTRQPVTVSYDYGGDLGVGRNRGRVQAYNAVLGLTRRLGDWSASTQVAYGRQRESWRTTDINTYYLGLALAATDPNKAYNLIGDRGSTNKAVVDSLRGFDSGRERYETWSANLRADGPVIALPAGLARLAVGAEWRSDAFKDVWRSYYGTATPVTQIQSYPGRRGVAGAYVETRAPLVSPAMKVPGVRALDLSAAARVERYADMGTTTNPKLGLDWTIGEGVVVRGAYGRSFRAPSFQDLRSGPALTNYVTLSLPDPTAPGGATKVLALIGNLPGLRPERARTWSAGVDLRPAVLPGFHANATYFHIRYADRLANLNANLFSVLTNRTLYGSIVTDRPSAAQLDPYWSSPFFHNISNFGQADIGAIVDVRNRNLSTVREDGVDLDVAYRFHPAGDALEFGVSATKIFNLRTQVAQGAPIGEVLGTVGYPVDLRARGRVVWTRDAWSAAAFANYTGDYQNQTVIPARRVKAWTTVDLQLAYAPSSGPWAGSRAALSVSNAFDRDPPFAEIRSSTSAIGYDGEKANPIGRLVAIDLVKSW